MASEHFVKLTTISALKEHPNADSLEIAEIEGWQVVPRKGTFQVGDKVIFVPVDSVVPEKWAKEWGVYDYLGGKQHNRVRCVKLRGEPSYGFTVPIPDELSNTKVGTDVKNFFGITKYEPPVRGSSSPQGQARACHPLLPKYTGIENLRSFMGVFEEGEEVVITEKIHGANFRVGLVNSILPKQDIWSKILRFFRIENRTEETEEWVAGSHNVQREIPKDPTSIPYTFPYADTQLKNMISLVKRFYDAKQVIVYGEVYGPSIQKLDYGIKEGYEYRVFDILIDGKYLDWTHVSVCCNAYKVPLVPELYIGPFSVKLVKELAEGKTTLPNANHIREGVVVKPAIETNLSNGKRKILKCKGAEYLIWKESKKGSDYTEE